MRRVREMVFILVILEMSGICKLKAKKKKLFMSTTLGLIQFSV